MVDVVHGAAEAHLIVGEGRLQQCERECHHARDLELEDRPGRVHDDRALHDRRHRDVARRARGGVDDARVAASVLGPRLGAIFEPACVMVEHEPLASRVVVAALVAVVHSLVARVADVALAWIDVLAGVRRGRPRCSHPRAVAVAQITIRDSVHHDHAEAVLRDTVPVPHTGSGRVVTPDPALHEGVGGDQWNRRRAESKVGDRRARRARRGGVRCSSEQREH